MKQVFTKNKLTPYTVASAVTDTQFHHPSAYPVKTNTI